MKLLMENWREYLNEQEEASPTVGQFLATWQKQNPSSVQKILGKTAKYLGGLVGATIAGSAAGAATSGLGAAVGATAGGALGAKLGEEAVSRIFGLIASKSSELARFMTTMANQQVADDQRSGIDLYYDLDDEYEALLQGMDSDLAKIFQKDLFTYFSNAFAQMDKADPEDPLSNYLKATANQYLEHFLLNKSKSKVGVAIKKLGKS